MSLMKFNSNLMKTQFFDVSSKVISNLIEHGKFAACCDLREGKARPTGSTLTDAPGGAHL